VQGRWGRAESDPRGRICEALAAALSERGLYELELAEVAARAGISAQELGRQFADIEECFLAAFDWCSARAGAMMADAYDQETRWVDGTRAALAALLESIEWEPEIARLWVVYSLGAGPPVLRARAAAVAVLCEYIDRGRNEAAARMVPPAITAEGVVGALLAILQTRLLATDPEPPSELLGELMSLIVLPYLGGAAARRELTRPPRRLSQPRHGGRTAVEGVGMRLTYRTARVLMAIAERPGSSNREVGNRAEVVDQGQISKLLSRLESQALIVNIGVGDRRGAPNAWELTPRGEEVERIVRRTAEESERGKGPSGVRTPKGPRP
jgi:AcrR family transcriptional regulator/DNA-binding MarR family transcriptional regulator